MSAEAFNAVLQSELAGMQDTFAEFFIEGLEDRVTVVRSLYWWQRLAIEGVKMEVLKAEKLGDIHQRLDDQQAQLGMVASEVLYGGK